MTLTCQIENYKKEGQTYQLSLTQEQTLCYIHAHDAGFCISCKEYYEGLESFDFYKFGEEKSFEEIYYCEDCR